MRASASKRPAEGKSGAGCEVVPPVEKRTKSAHPGDFDVHSLDSPKELWDIIQYLQKQVKKAKFGPSFWHNIDMIVKCRYNDGLIVAYERKTKELAGYLCCPGSVHCSELRKSDIEIMEVVSSYRRKGVGRQLVRELEALVSRGFDRYEDDEFASPQTTASNVTDAAGFWLAIGYEKYPFKRGGGHDIYYRINGYNYPAVYGQASWPGRAYVISFEAKFSHYKVKEAQQNYGHKPVKFHIYTCYYNHHDLEMFPAPRTTSVTFRAGDCKEQKQFLVSALGEEYPAEQELAAELVKLGVIQQVCKMPWHGDEIGVYELTDKTKGDLTFRYPKIMPPIPGQP